MRKILSFVLWGVLLCFATPAMAQLSELSGKIIKSIGGEATSLTTNQWYLMYNRGRQTYAYENTGHNMIYVKADGVPSVEDNADEKCAFLIRLVNGNSSGQYYLQTGYGHYFGSLTQGSSNNVTTNKSVYYTYNTINGTGGHFYFNDANGKIMDANGPGDASLAGWNDGSVSSLNGNNDWAFYAVTLIRISVFLPIPYCLNDCSLVVEPEVRQVDCSRSIWRMHSPLSHTVYLPNYLIVVCLPITRMSLH